MTVGTLDFAGEYVAVRRTYTCVTLFVAPESTSDPEAARRAKLQRLADWSTSENGLDWDALARINIDGWGADTNAE